MNSNSSETPIDGFLGSKFVKGSVGRRPTDLETKVTPRIFIHFERNTLAAFVFMLANKKDQKKDCVSSILVWKMTGTLMPSPEI